ncbi:arylacetamide deacetylase-like 4 [Strix aluco]|uniref:arylacetamide deacetylase-like 4 n=1 Tax=Strix aluco TaxID=111821 RepID=UPI003DA3C5FF
MCFGKGERYWYYNAITQCLCYMLHVTSESKIPSIPPGVNNPGKLRILLASMITTSAMSVSRTHGPTCSGARCQSNPARPGAQPHGGLPRLHLLLCQHSGEGRTGAAAKGEGRGERLWSRLSPADTKPGRPSGLTAAGGRQARGIPHGTRLPRGGCWLPPGRPPPAQPDSPPSLRTGEDFGKSGGVQPDRLHPLLAVREEAGAGPTALAAGRAVRRGADSHEKICRYIARESESVVVSVGYRLAPENKYPAAYEDCLNATIHFMKNIEHYGVDPARIIVCGDSAGGNLAAAVSQTLAGGSDLPKLRAQILIYPGLQAVDFNLPSYQQNQGVPLLIRKHAAFFALQYLNGDALHMQEVLEGSHIPPDMRLKYRKWVSPDNIPEKFKVRGYKPHKPREFKAEVFEKVKRLCEPNLCPLLVEDAVVQQLPESFILTCEYDVLRDDGLLYKKRLEDNGVRVTWYHLEDGFHGIIGLHDYRGLSFPAGKRGLDRIVKFIKGL